MAKRVHRVLPKVEPDVVEEDHGIPGKLYFDKPKIIEMASFRKSAVPEFDPIGGRYAQLGPEEFYLRETPVRLRSSHKQGPNYNPPESVVYPLSLRPTQEEATEYIRLRKVDGFGEGTIVARRYAEYWKAKWHGNWGIIKRVIGYVPHITSTPWNPYVVQWFEQQTSEESAWAEDLVVIHCTLDKDLLEDILEAQGIAKQGK